MKKFLSLLLAVVMVIGMLPAGAIFASAAEVSETLTITGSTGTLASDSSSISWTSDNVTFTNGKGSTAIRNSDSAHYRMYAGSSVTITCKAGNITKIVLTATSSSYANVLVASAGSEATASGSTVTIVPTEPVATYSIASLTAQSRINNVAVTYSNVDSSACEHTNTEEIAAVEATCTTPGNTAGEKCADCGEILSGNETIPALGHTNDEGVVTAPTCTEDGYTTYTCTVCGKTAKSDYVDATGHTYVDGACSVCGVEKPAGLDGKYYIAAIRSSGNYQYMTNDLGTASTKRYQATDSGLTELPESIAAEDENAAYVFELITSGNGYIIKSGDQYLGYTSGNSGALVAEADAKVVTIENGTEGAYVFHFTVSADDERYLALNNTATSNYFAWYKGAGNQVQNLYLVPVAEPCQHTNTTTTTVDATCTAAGSTTVTCADCGEVISTEEIAILDHTYVNGACSVCGEADPAVCQHEAQTTTTVDATCTVAGSVTVTCDACGEVISTEEIAALGHTEVVDAAVAATCTTTGLTEGSHCSVCNEVIVAQEEVATLDHDYVNNVCSVCGQAKPAPVATISFADDTQRVSQDASAQVWSNGGLTVTNNKASSTSPVANYVNPARFYKNSELVFAFPSMTTIEVTCSSADYATALKNSISDSNATVTVSEKVVTIVLTNAVDTFTIAAMSAQVRVSSVTVTGVVGVCAHEVSEWTTTVEATCETAGTQTGTCSKCGEAQVKEIPALGHSYAYHAETAMMVCATCGDTVMNTIAEAKAYTDAAKVYYIKGIVTYVSGQTVYMQDATGGICVYFTDAESATGIAVGTELLVMDTMTTYKGLIETTYTESTEIQVLSEGNQLPVQSVTLADLNADTTNEYLGERVVITDLTIGMINSASTTALTDANGNSINLFKATGLASNVTENDIVTVTAIVSTYNGYQLIVNPGTAATDVVVTTEGVPSNLELSTVATAKAGTEGAFFKVQGVVTFVDGASVYMQDATAGIVARLAADVTAPAIGTEIEVIGAYTTYNGLIQLEGATFTEVSTGNTVEAKTVTIADLTSATDNAYLSEKVALKEVEITAVGTYNTQYSNVDYTVSDGTNTIKLYRTPAASADTVLTVGTVINVVAVVGTYNGYQLRVASVDDISVVVKNVALWNKDGEVATYANLADALVEYDEGVEYVKLLADIDLDTYTEEFELTGNLYIDMNGFDLKGTLNTDGYTVYAMDSTTNEYTCEDVGVFSCVEGESAIVPVFDWSTTEELTGAITRYVALSGETGYTFHRIFLGITHVSIKTANTGIGYKAVFCADEMVQAQLGGHGYTLQLGDFAATAKTVAISSFANKEAVALRVNNYDIKNFGEMDLKASVYMTIGGVTITSAEVSYSMRDMLELAAATDLSASQIQALQNMILPYIDVMDGWAIDSLRPAEEV